MYIGVKKVKPLDNYCLLLTFENSEQRIFDVSPYLDTGIFSELKGNLFFSVVVDYDTVSWANGADLDPEVLYEQSVLYKP